MNRKGHTRKREREPGFYWVRRRPGEWRVAEYRVDASGTGRWLMAGVRQHLAEGYFNDVGPKIPIPGTEGRDRT